MWAGRCRGTIAGPVWRRGGAAARPARVRGAAGARVGSVVYLDGLL